MATHETLSVGVLTLTGTSPQVAGVVGPVVLIQDLEGNALLAFGTAVPGAVAGYAKGCLFIDTDVAAGTTGLYCNKGTKTAAQFTAVTQA